MEIVEQNINELFKNQMSFYVNKHKEEYLHRMLKEEFGENYEQILKEQKEVEENLKKEKLKKEEEKLKKELAIKKLEEQKIEYTNFHKDLYNNYIKELDNLKLERKNLNIKIKNCKQSSSINNKQIQENLEKDKIDLTKKINNLQYRIRKITNENKK